MYKLFLCLRYLRKRRIAFFAVLAVALCVAMVLIVVSVMGGFLQMVKDRSRGMLGDLVVENASLLGFPYYQELIDTIKRDMPDEVYEATPVIINYGVIRFPDDQITKYAQLVGIRLEETYRVNDFKNGLFYDKYYPGTTSFEPQKQAYYGIDANNEYALPPDLEAARAKFEASASKDQVLSAWRPFSDLFEIPDAGYKRELNAGRIPEAVRTAFAKQYYSLPASARVAVVKPSMQWQILGGDGLFALERSEGKLRVRKCQYPGPGYYEPVTAYEQRNPDSVVPLWGGKELPGIILGTDLCARRTPTGEYDRYYGRGTVVQLMYMPFSPSGDISDATGVSKKLMRYVDDERTGIYDIDSCSVYMDFDTLQSLLKMDDQTLAEEAGGGIDPARATQVQIKLQPGVIRDRARTEAVRGRIAAVWEGIVSARIGQSRHPELLRRVEVLTWEEKQAKFIAAVEKEKVLVTFLFGVISVVAVFLVGCIFYMIVQQKTRDIGIIKSVGATSLGVAGIFLAYGAAVGVVGGALGTVIGTIFVRRINEIQELLASFNPNLRVWNAEVYAFDHIPNHVNAWDAGVIYLVAILASMLGSLIAAYRASRVWPVEALRYE